MPQQLAPSPLVARVADRLAHHPDGKDWTLRPAGFWCHLEPVGFLLRKQGWKLHVSATGPSALEVLDAVLAVLLPARCPFKFAAHDEHVRMLNSSHIARGSAGKFVTAYPVDDDQFRQLAAELDQATAHLTGPLILSDRAYRPGSLVHYRYGAFVSEQVLGNDGIYLEMITRPDGTKVEDRRDPWFAPPAWAPLPFGDAAVEADDEPDGVLLANRFVVRRAIRHANKGGVFEATDRLSGEEVVIKQARAKVAQGAGGWDLQVALRNEAEMLDRLSRSGSTPRLIALFEQEGDLFCVQERVQGRTLRSWRDEQPPGDPCWEMAGQVVALLASVHAAGVVLRDLSPLNLMVRPDGGLTLIDLEFAARRGTVAPTARTPAYSAPEQCDELAADFAADLYALGRVLFLLCTGADPILPPDEPVVRSGSDRLAAWLRLVAATDEQVRQLEPLILGLVQDRPEQRWPLDRVADFLVRRPQADRGRLEPTGESEAGLDRLLTDAVDYLLGSMTPAVDHRLWPGSKNGAQGDGCNVYHGAGGVLATLTTITALTGDERIRDGVRIAADWLAERVTRQDPLPGLYFGRSGTAWALTEAAALLGDRDLSGQALALLDRLPPSWPNPDVTHGLAGAGYAALAVGTAGQHPALLTRARRYAEQLADRAERRDGLVLWPVPDSFDSQLAGLVDYGFAHGAAGIASYLLAAGNRLGEPSWVELAAETADGLGKVVVENGREARWTSGPRNRIQPLEQWCSGSAGIGTFLIRVAHVTGDSRAAELAEKAAEAVWSRRWQAGPSDCHGLAGGGQFLLDLADLTGDERYRRRAGELADVLLVRAARRDGLLLAPDETMTGFGADYSVGISGWLAFLVRLRYGGARPWMVEP